MIVSINIFAIFAILLLQITLAASAAEVNSFMTNTTHKFYRKVDNATKVSFEITAQRFIEDYSQIKKKSYLLFSLLESKKVTRFQKGTLYLKNSHFQFSEAFWSQGKLVLKDVSGITNQQRLIAPVIHFNKRTMEVTAEKITLKSGHKISRKLNFHHRVEALTYPYQKISFYTFPQG